MNPSRYDLIDRILDGKLAETLAAYRAEGLTLDRTVQALREDHDVDVSRETLRRWLSKSKTAA